jgi:putative flippase GtrA
VSGLRAGLAAAPEVVRFGLVAVIGLVVDIAVGGAAALWLDVPLVLAAAFGFASGACINYALHELWTFRSGARRLSFRRALKYAVTLGITLAVRLAAVVVLENVLGAGRELMVLILATGVSFGMNYVTSKFVVFRAAGETTDRMDDRP